MLSEKKYLACQAIVTSFFIHILDILCNYLIKNHSFPGDIKFSIPFISVLLSYICIIFLARFSLPSINEVRFATAIKKIRKQLINQINCPNITEERKNKLIEKLNDLNDLELTKNEDILNACKNDLKTELGSNK